MAKFNLNQLLSGASKNGTAEEAENKNKPDAFEVIPISVYDLVPSKDNFYSVENIQELKDSIEMFGLKQNLTVKAVEEGKYIVIAGHRRRLASLALVEEGKKEFEFVPCSIENDLDYIKEQLLLITTNSTTRQLTDWEKTQQAEKIKNLLEEYKKKEKLPGRIREIIASILNTSSTQVGRMDSISKNLSSDFKKEFKEEKINISTAYELSTLPSEAQQEVFTEYAQNGSMSISEVKEKKKKAEIKAEVEKVPEMQVKPKEIIKEESIQPKEKLEALPPLPSIYEIIKDMNVQTLAAFICCRCDSIGRFCDFAAECNQRKESERQGICIRWLEMQAQKSK